MNTKRKTKHRNSFVLPTEGHEISPSGFSTSFLHFLSAGQTSNRHAEKSHAQSLPHSSWSVILW